MERANRVSKLMNRFPKLALVGIIALAQFGAASQAADSKASVLTGAQVIQILDDTVEWYRALGTQQQNATQPSDMLLLSRTARPPTRS